MATAAAWLVVSEVVAVAGTAYAAYSTVQANRFEGKVEERNASNAAAAAADALQRGAAEEGAHRMKVQRLISSQKTALGASGVDISSGSALDVLSDTAALGELDALTLRNNASREAWGYKVESGSALARSSAARSRASNAAVGGLLSLGGQVGEAGYRYRKSRPAGGSPLTQSQLVGGGSLLGPG